MAMKTAPIYLEDCNVQKTYLKIFQKFSILIRLLSPPGNSKHHKVTVSVISEEIVWWKQKRISAS